MGKEGVLITLDGWVSVCAAIHRREGGCGYYSYINQSNRNRRWEGQKTLPLSFPLGILPPLLPILQLIFRGMNILRYITSLRICEELALLDWLFIQGEEIVKSITYFLFSQSVGEGGKS